MEAAKAKYGEVSHGFAMNLWDATIEENILVVCKTPMAKSITKRSLAGFRNARVNAQYYPNLIENISERPEAVVNTFRDGKHFWKINNNTNMRRKVRLTETDLHRIIKESVKSILSN